jgi:hypothetical protein
MIAAIVVPLGSCSIFRTVACLDEPRAAGFAVPAFVGAGFDRAGGVPLAVCFATRDDLRDFFAAFDFGLVAATWLSGSVKRQHHMLPLTRPRRRFGGAAGEGESAVIRPITGSAARRPLKTIGIVDQLLDVHRNGDAFGDAAGQRTGFRGLGDPCGFGQLDRISLSKSLIAGSMVARSMRIFSGARWSPHTLSSATKSSKS